MIEPSIRDRFVIDPVFVAGGGGRSVVHRRRGHEVRDYEQRPWREKKMLPC